MMRIFLVLCLTLLSFSQTLRAVVNDLNNGPESAYLFAYATDKDRNHNGLHFAWSLDKETWHAIGPEHPFVKCDYGRWGSEKRMITPYLFQASDGVWHCVWSLNEYDGAFSYVTSKDLVYWRSQSYPLVTDKNCIMPEISFNKVDGSFFISWLSGDNKDVYSVSTKNFKEYTPSKKSSSSDRLNDRQRILVGQNEVLGTVHEVPWSLIDNLIKSQQLSAYKSKLYSETTATDLERFASLKPVDATVAIDADKSKKISDLLLGVFFEDINYAADGGLYAELVQNRDFEYALSDREGRDKNWNNYTAWKLNNDNASFIVDSISPIHENNKFYAKLQIKTVGAGLVNEGFDGIPVKAGEKYNLSVFARTSESNKGKIKVRLISKEGVVYAESVTKNISSDWKKYEVVLVAKQTDNDARLEVVPQMEGRVDLDMISLFPQKTFRERKNGLRADLAQVIADMNPRFVRFPGGCLAHGDGLHNMYRWENTVGPLEARVPQRNIWGYHQTVGLGYFEYFQFCEDLGAEPLPVVAAGVPCQNSAHHGCALGGQQGGIPMSEMDAYIQSVLDLIEWANGDKNTKWGRVRAEAGHPKPFNLKYIGIGNEDLISDVFEERFTMIFNAVKEKYPEITVIGTVGPFYEGTDYVEGWRLATELGVPMVDEHYYNPPGWYIHNQDYYDRYDRSKAKVYLGEYAAHLPGRPVNIETALAEAIHMATLERNGDIVSMSSYAPLLAKDRHTQWNPDLIYFNNTEVRPTVGYYVQKLYGQHAGDEYLSNKVTLSNTQDAVVKRIVVSSVRDTKTNDLIVKLVNMLPVEVNTTVKLDNVENMASTAKKIVLTGTPDDRKAMPTESEISVSNEFPCSLPAYSFTVIRIKPETLNKK